MKIHWIKEQQIFSIRELECLLNCDADSKAIIDRLEYLGIFQRTLSKTDCLGVQTETIGFLHTNIDLKSQNTALALHFVGILVVREVALICFPKYIAKKEPYQEMGQIFKVFEKPQIEPFLLIDYDQEREISLNWLEIIRDLIQDFLEHGLYCHLEKFYEKNGQGIIDWDRTISTMQPLFDECSSYYLNFITRSRRKNADYFTKLHACILTQISKYLHDLGIDRLFDVPEINLFNGSINDFGNQDFILGQIEKEMGRQFSMCKQHVLKLMSIYVRNYFDHKGISIFGTTHFEQVWEEVLSFILDNQLDERLIDLNLGDKLSEKYDPLERLIDIIENPLWTFTKKRVLDTFIPDVITLKEWELKHYFIICDAKYYVPHLDEGIAPTNQPGIEAVAKQYCYEMAYREFICDHNLIARNCFLFPTEEADVLSKGEVKMKIFEKAGLQPIRVRYIPAMKAYELFLKNKRYDLRDLDL